MLIRFRGRIFGKDGAQWYVWEPRWDSMRPIDGYGWNGRGYVLLDSAYVSDPFDELFGFGTAEMRDHCAEVTARWIDSLDSVPESVDAVIGSPVWWRDGWVVLANPEVPLSTWKSRRAYLGTRPRTCRQVPRGRRTTKRDLRKNKGCA